MNQREMGQHAIVIGGSMAGLLTARVLSDHFARVTLIERDKMNDAPESRKGQPQTRHLHALLARGLEIMTHYFPELPQALQEAGAIVDDMTVNMHWYCYGGYRMPYESGLRGALMSRPLLEWLIRRRVFALPNVEALDECDVENLVAAPDQTRITGVTIIRRNQGRQRETLSADFVVDAGGRGASSPKWLEALGYGRPEEEAVTVNVGYATRIYRRDPADPLYKKWVFITPEAPRERRAGGAFPIEEDRWLVTLGGWAGDHSPPDEPGFLEFAKNLPAPDIYHLISRSEPLSDIVTHKFPSSLRRRYDRMRRFPEGYLVMGDAACSFNPLYGQGMSVAALQAADLDELLRERAGRQEGLRGIAKPFFQRAAKSIQTPWEIAVGEDFRFPETVGKRSLATSLINRYMDWIHRATHHDRDVCHAFVCVMNLLAPPPSLFRPRIVWRAFRYGRAASTPTTHRAKAPAVRSHKRDPLETTDQTT